MATFIPHRCDFCRFGIVWPIVARREPIRLRDGVVVLEGFIIGQCNGCSQRYFPADVIKRADAAARKPQHVISVPIVEA